MPLSIDRYKPKKQTGKKDIHDSGSQRFRFNTGIAVNMVARTLKGIWTVGYSSPA